MCGLCPHSGVFFRTPHPAKLAQVLLAEDHAIVRSLSPFVRVRTLPLAAVPCPRRPVAHEPGGPTRADPLAAGAVPARQPRILPLAAPLSRQKFVNCLGQAFIQAPGHAIAANGDERAEVPRGDSNGIPTRGVSGQWLTERRAFPTKHDSGREEPCHIPRKAA
jgi:hypothetical protein